MLPGHVPTIRVQCVMDAAGVHGKVTAHAVYAAPDELPTTDAPQDGQPAAPVASADVDLSELPAEVMAPLAVALANIKAAAEQRLTRRISDAVFESRQVARARREITR